MKTCDELLVEELTVRYEDKPVIWDVHLKVPSQNIIGVIGPNGAGKSTLFKGILGLCSRASGSISFMGNPLEQMQGQIAYVGQKNLIDWDFPITVSQVISMGAYHRLGWFKRSSRKEKERTQTILERLGLAKFQDRQISALSGGQQQRLFLGRALMQEAKVYFFDEPFVGIDMATECLIMDILRQLVSEGKTIFIIHHDLHRIKEYFDWLIMINKVVIAQGPTESVYTQENITKLFGQQGTLLERALDLSHKQKEGLE